MALNPEIALGVRPPALQPLDIQSPLERFGKALTLRGMMEQQQLRGLQRQQAEQELAQTRQAAENEANFQKLYADPTAKPTRSQVYSTLGPKGAAVVKTQAEIEEQDIKTRAQQFALRGSIAGAITDAPSFTRGVMQAVSVKALDPETGRSLLAAGWNSQTQAQIKQFALESLEHSKQLEQQLKDAEERRKEALAGPQLAEAKAKSLGEQLGVAAQTAPNSQAEWDVWRADLSPELQKRIPAMFSPVVREQVRMMGVKPTAPAQPTPGLSPERFRQEKELRAIRAPVAGGQDDESLAATVIENPSLWENLTPSAKTRIAPLLSERGFTDFGKPLGEAAMTKIAESRSAIESLKDLRQTLKDNEQYIGPIAGFQAMNPYSEARQAQAKIDLVKQRVGKALEGGVLRKEDEEKYKKILATLRDTPESAIAKVDSLLTTIDRDIKLFEEQQRRGGRNVPEAKAAAPTSGGMTQINTKEEYYKLPKGAQYVDAQDGKTYTKR